MSDQMATTEFSPPRSDEDTAPPQYSEDPPTGTGFVQSGQEGGASVVTGQPTYGSAGESQVNFRDFPVWITDDKGNRVQTELRYKNGLLTWIAMLVLCLICSNFGLCFLCLIPLCIKPMKDVEHVNPVDGTVVGVFHRIQH